MSTLATTSRVGSICGSLALVLGSLAMASPAQAAAAVDLAAASPTVTVGDDVELSWTSTDAVTLEASGAWSGSKTPPSGSESVPTTEEGTFTYTLVATDADEAQATDSVTVVVEAAPVEDAAVTPNPVTFPDGCTVVVPETENVTYAVDYGDGDVEQIPAGTYDGLEFDIGGDPVTFFAEADAGFELAEGADTEWEYTTGDECFFPEADLVDVTATCGKVTFTNIHTQPVDVSYGNLANDMSDGDFELAVGQSRTISTSRSSLIFVAFGDAPGSEGFESVEIDELEVPQNCPAIQPSRGATHPTVAPAAGLRG